jgi:hypothetical protein
MTSKIIYLMEYTDNTSIKYTAQTEIDYTVWKLTKTSNKNIERITTTIYVRRISDTFCLYQKNKLMLLR